VPSGTIRDHVLEIHPVIVAGIALFQLVHIHPFVDGNGRSARLLSTLCLYRTGCDFKRLFTISEYYDRDRPAYYKALQGVRERGMNMNRRTLQRDLKLLVEKGLVREVGTGPTDPTKYYEPLV
jgi:Fic family protein